MNNKEDPTIAKTKHFKKLIEEFRESLIVINSYVEYPNYNPAIIRFKNIIDELDIIINEMEC